VRFGLAPLALIAAMTAGAAHAQETGSMRPDTSPVGVPEGRSTGDAARAVHDDFAQCIVKRHYIQVTKTLAGPTDLAKDHTTLPKLMDKACFFGSSSVGKVGGLESVEVTTNPIAFRGGLFKALVVKDFARKPVAFGATPVEMIGDNSDMLTFADCVVRRNPAASLTLIKTTAGAAAEQAALGALTPDLSECAAQNRLSMRKGTLIGFVAEAYYRESIAAKSMGVR